jgi:uncharacterized tellurite resistance protein B-like protein
MNQIAEVATNAISSSKGDQLPSLDQIASQINDQSNSSVDAGQFRAALERHMSDNAQHPERAGMSRVDGPGATSKQSLGDKIIGRTTSLATELKADQQHVSKLLEQATRSGDEVQLMKAMTALNDYEMRVQFVSKVVAKTTTGIDQLTRLQ